MDYFDMQDKHRGKIELPEGLFKSVLKKQKAEGDAVITVLEEVLKKQGIDIPPNFIKIAIFIAVKKYEMHTFNPDILQKAVLDLYNISDLMEFLEDDNNPVVVKQILSGRQTVEELIQMSDEFKK